MSATSSLFNVMFTFSDSLLYPVTLILMLMVVHALVLIGEFLSEYSRRHRNVKELESCCTDIREHARKGTLEKAAVPLRALKQNSMVTNFSKDAAEKLEKGNFKTIGWLSQDYEIRMAKRLEQTRIVATTAPMLGLMGTLIPLGPALMGLAEGNLGQLASNLMIAFATTVVGLFAASIAYVLTQIRKRWYWQDMTDIDYIIDTLEGDE